MKLLVLLLASVIAVALGAVVLLSRRKQVAARYFFFLTLSVAVWAAGIGLFLQTTDQVVAVLLVQVYYIAAAAIGLFFLLVAMTLGRERATLSVDGLLCMPFLALSTVIAVTPHWLIQSVSLTPGNNSVALTQNYSFYVVYFVIYYLAAMVVLIVRISREHDIRNRTQMIYVAHAYGWAGVIGCIFNLFLPAAGNYSLIWIGPLSLFFFALVTYFAITRHGLFNVKQAVTRTIAYISSLATLGVIYSFVIFVGSTLVLRDTGDLVASPLSVALMLVLAFVFQPIKGFFDKITDKIFYHDRYNAGAFIASFSKSLASVADVHSLLYDAAKRISETLRAEQVSFLLKGDGTEANLIVGTDGHIKLRKNEIAMLEDTLQDNRQTVLVAALLEQRGALGELLVRQGIALIAPLVYENTIEGYLFIGERRSGEYTRYDSQTVQTIADEFVVAVQNTKYAQELHDLNATLQQRIDEATRELRESNAKLQRLDKAKDEFVSMASHQLRTPLTSVKGYVSMVLEGDAGKITPAQAKLLGEAYASSERMVHLIGDFLNVSRLQTGKFMLESRPIDLTKLVAREVKSLQPAAKLRGLTLKYRSPSYFPLLNLDEGKVQQVVMNFIDNAIYYSRDNGTITVTLEKAGGMVELRVRDDGIGVPKAEQEHLFTKFFRAENARKQRPDGTGVGLFLAKKVIDAHSGSIIFESQEGKGSTFGFRLPIKKLAAGSDTDNLRNQDDQQDNHTDSD